MIGNYILQDIKLRYRNLTILKFIYHILCTPDIRLIVSCRICKYLKHKKIYRGGYFVMKLYHRHLEHKYLVCFDDSLEFGSGLCFPHGGPFVINGGAKIGKYCTIHPDVLIGGDRSKKKCPVIGDYVFIGNGAKLIGNCKVGNWCFISPAAVITKDIPEYSVVGCGLNNVINSDGKRHVELYL